MGGDQKSSYVFIRDPEYAWIPAVKESATDKTAIVRVPQYADETSTICDGGATAKSWVDDEVDLKDYNRGVLPMQNVDQNGHLKSFPDMVNLPFLHEVCNLLLLLLSLFEGEGMKKRIEYAYRK